MNHIISAFFRIVNYGRFIPLKNRQSVTLLLVTCVFAAFTLGFLAGRATAPGDTIIARMPASTQPATLPQDTVPAVNLISPVTVATEPTATEPPAAEPSQSGTAGLININTATLEQLDTLPGIGPVIGQRIIDYREQHGPFTSVGQLVLVDGIGEKRLGAIIDLITVE
jgi:competence ComEA-like helix-hairpin-helix protein